MLFFLAAVASATPAIDAHLEQVESDLRSADVSALHPEAARHRERLLDVLGDYAEAGQYPRNLVSSQGRSRPVPLAGGFPEAHGRTPVFVDGEGTHCAVGYLLAVDGRDDLVAAVVQSDNLAFVHELQNPALEEWAADRGFSLDELARIQPSYDFEEDADNDGWTAPSDCDDNDRSVNPDADEVCADETDNDCDGEIDETECVDKGCSSSDGAAMLALLPLALLRRRT